MKTKLGRPKGSKNKVKVRRYGELSVPIPNPWKLQDDVFKPKKQRIVRRNGRIEVVLTPHQYSEIKKSFNFVKWLIISGIILFATLLALIVSQNVQAEKMCEEYGHVLARCSDFVKSN